MRKQIICTITVAVFGFMLLSGCKSSLPSEPRTQDESRPPLISSEPFQEIQMEQSFSTDDIEITFTNKLLTSTVAWKRDDGTELSLGEQNGQIYFIIFGTAKSLAESEINLYNGLCAELIIDQKYKYPVNIDPVSLSSIVPLKTVTFAIYSEIPTEVLDECKEYQLLLGFNEGLLPAEDVYACKQCYKYDGTLEEYGSSEFIQNFQTFKEFITKEADKVSLPCKVKEDPEEVWIGGDETFWFFELDDGTEFTATCNLILNYKTYDIYDEQNQNCGYGALRIEIKEFPSSDRTAYYTGTERIEITSDNGTVEMDKTTIPGYSYDYSHTSHTSDVSFTFWSNEYSFEQLMSVLSGNNTRIFVDIKASGGEMLTIDIGLNEERTEALKSYLEYYKLLPMALFN